MTTNKSSQTSILEINLVTKDNFRKSKPLEILNTFYRLRKNSMEIRKSIELNGNENMLHIKIDAAKMAFRGKFIALNVHMGLYKVQKIGAGKDKNK